MRVGVTYDLRTDYGIPADDLTFSDFCFHTEIGYMENAINRNGYEAVMIGNMYKLNERIKSGNLGCDIVLVCDEGLLSRNREAIVPALLELNKIPYVGSDAYCMGLSQNKYHTKLVARSLGIRCPNGIYLEYGQKNEPEMGMVMDMIEKAGLSFPLIVKPNEEGYSMGVFLVKDEEGLRDGIRYNFSNYHEPVLVEEYIGGKELFVPMIGTGDDAYALEVGSIVAADGSDIAYYSVEDKSYDWSHHVVEKIDADAREEMIEMSLKLYRHMGCRDFGRCDFRMEEGGRPVFIEITPRPGLTEDGPFEICAKSLGRTYDMVLREVIDSAAKRYGLKD